MRTPQGWLIILSLLFAEETSGLADHLTLLFAEDTSGPADNIDSVVY
jgi:hypothetical protein